jgi:hypothetical protein
MAMRVVMRAEDATVLGIVEEGADFSLSGRGEYIAHDDVAEDMNGAVGRLEPIALPRKCRPPARERAFGAER